LERIPTDRIAKLIENIAAHLAPDGIFVASVDIMPDGNPVLGARCSQRTGGWNSLLQSVFARVALNPFNTRDYVQRNGIELTDWDPLSAKAFISFCKKYTRGLVVLPVLVHVLTMEVRPD
jgi:hypothetical protein